MNVIFLDIDGVMNSHVFYEKRHKKRWFRFKTYKWWILSTIKYIFNGFKHKPIQLTIRTSKPRTFEYKFNRLKEETDKQKWLWLSEFCNKNDYKICISSVWKNHFDKQKHWIEAFEKLGFNDDIFVGITGERRTLRGTEIKEWADSHQIKSYVILDDDMDMLPEQLSSCFFHVDGYFGLTPNHLYRINNYFNKLKNITQ